MGSSAPDTAISETGNKKVVRYWDSTTNAWVDAPSTASLSSIALLYNCYVVADACERSETAT